MNILAFSTYYLPYVSGLTMAFHHVLKSRVEDGDQVTLLTFRYAEDLSSNDCIDGVLVFRQEYWFRVSKGFVSIPFTTLRYVAQIYRSDVVFLNLPNFEGIGAAVLAKLFGKPVIALFNCEVVPASNLAHRTVVEILGLSVRLQLRLSDRIVAFTKDYVNTTQMLRAHRDKIEYILPLVHLFPQNPGFAKQLEELKGNSVWIGFCGRVSSEKGLLILVSAIEILRKNPEFANATLVFAGPYGDKVAGETKTYRALLERLMDLKIPHHFLGTIPNSDLFTFYQFIDVLTLPSLNRTEAFGMVQAEALCCGTWVVASNLPGVRVCVELTGHGALVEPGRSDDLSDKLKSVLKNPHRLNRLENGQRAQMIFRTQNFASRWKDVFRKASLDHRPKH